MIVKAAPGLTVPFEENPRRYITDDTFFNVAETAYYTRRLSDGDLIAATDEDWNAQEKAKLAAEALTVKAAEKAQKIAAEKAITQ